MSPAETRFRLRPNVKPIRTEEANRAAASKAGMKWTDPAWTVSPGSAGLPKIVYPESQQQRIQMEDKTMTDKLGNITNLSPKGTMPAPEYSRTAGKQPKAATNPRKKSLLKPLIIEPLDGRTRAKSAELAKPEPMSAALRSITPYSAIQFDRLSAASPTTAVSRYLHFQRFRETLWKRGQQDFGNAGLADAFVRPVELGRKLGTSPLSVETDSPQTPALTGQLTVRVLIHSKGRASIGMRRAFDADALRATVPEPSPSPRSPNFDRDALLSAVAPREDIKPPPSPMATRSSHCRSSVITPGSEPVRSPLLERKHQFGPPAVPMHIQYVRAHLPVLASIMMSELVRRGDTIDLPLPYPRAWSETAAFVYTGEEELLTEQVKQNITYLGGKA